MSFTAVESQNERSADQHEAGELEVPVECEGAGDSEVPHDLEACAIDERDVRGNRCAETGQGAPAHPLVESTTLSAGRKSSMSRAVASAPRRRRTMETVSTTTYP